MRQILYNTIEPWLASGSPSEWDLRSALQAVKLTQEEAQKLIPPKERENAHAYLLSSLAHAEDGADLLLEVLDNQTEGAVQKAATAFAAAEADLERAIELLPMPF
jgi:hypothetical protein